MQPPLYPEAFSPHGGVRGGPGHYETSLTTRCIVCLDRQFNILVPEQLLGKGGVHQRRCTECVGYDYEGT
jgi:hypothetical protein